MPLENINNWRKWPAVTELLNGKEFLRRPWGELFVHNLYDKVEGQNEIIDNLIPQSNGVKHLLKKEGFFGTAADVARLLAFNIGQTSLAQKGALGQPPGGKLEWNVEGARQKGWELFAAANPDDFTRDRLKNPPDESWTAVRAQLDALARDTEAIPDDEVRNLCDKSKNLSPAGESVCPPKNPELLIDVVGGAIPGAAYRSMASHLKKRHETFPAMEVFVYGHTHILQCTTTVTPEGDTAVQVANTGAFQRLIDDERFVAEAARRGLDAAGRAREAEAERPSACYTAVLVTYTNGRPAATVQNWFQAETGCRRELRRSPPTAAARSSGVTATAARRARAPEKGISSRPRYVPCFSFEYCQSARSSVRIETPAAAAMLRVNSTYAIQKPWLYAGGFVNPSDHRARTSRIG